MKEKNMKIIKSLIIPLMIGSGSGLILVYLTITVNKIYNIPVETLYYILFIIILTISNMGFMYLFTKSQNLVGSLITNYSKLLEEYKRLLELHLNNNKEKNDKKN